MARTSGWFDIGDTDGQFKIAKWFPEPAEIEADLLHFSYRLHDMTEPLTGAKQAFIYSTKQHFYHEKGPDGEPWRKLNVLYREWKKEQGKGEQKILVLDGDLYKAATSEEAYEIVGSDIVFKVDVLPDYGPMHQAGYGGEEGEGGARLPSRPFIGADVKTIAEIEDIFLEWIDELIEKDWDGGGGGPPVVEMASNVHGTFPVAGYTSRGVPYVRVPGVGIRFGRKR